jgi:ABC-type nitrate/sulfonate/bicarbonate transport system permease component
MLKNKRQYLVQISGVITVFLIWEIAAIIIAQNFPMATKLLPTIEYTFRVSLPSMASYWGAITGRYGEASSYLEAFYVLIYHSGRTLLRVLGGSAIGIGLGIFIGLAIGWNKKLYDFINIPIQVIRVIPLLSLITLFLLWFGGREIGIYLYIIYAIFVMIVTNTIEAVKNVPRAYNEFALTLGASKSQVFSMVVLPAIVPELAGGIRVAMGLSWAIVLASEYLAADQGLGRILILSEKFFNPGRMIIITLLFMFYSLILDRLIKKIVSKYTRWKP